MIRSADKVQDAERRVAEVEKAMEEARAAQAPRREQIEAVRVECHERLAAARARRDDVAKQVNKPLLGEYERIRKGNTPLVLYSLAGHACGHCYTAVPIHRRQEIQGGRGVTSCEGCGVLVYDPVK